MVDLRTLVPFDEETVLASVQKTARAWSSTRRSSPAASAARSRRASPTRAFAWLDAPVKRVGLPRPPEPLRAGARARRCCPSRDKLLAAAREVLAF